jgi:hypothetical protein
MGATICDGTAGRHRCRVEKPTDSALTIPAHIREAVMQPSPEHRDRQSANAAVRRADPDPHR